MFRFSCSLLCIFVSSHSAINGPLTAEQLFLNQNEVRPQEYDTNILKSNFKAHRAATPTPTQDPTNKPTTAPSKTPTKTQIMAELDKFLATLDTKFETRPKI